MIDGTLYCHASPLSDVRSFTAQTAEDDRELLAGNRQRRVVFGHTHVQFRRQGPGAVELVNPGSVGMPWDGDHRAAYALVDEDGALELRRVGYDHGAVADELLERFGLAPWSEEIAGRLRRASL